MINHFKIYWIFYYNYFELELITYQVYFYIYYLNMYLIIIFIP